MTRPRAFAEQIRRRQAQRRPSHANQHGRHGNLHPVEQIRSQERRHRHATAFHEHARAAASPQPRNHLGQVHAARAIAHAHHLGLAHLWRVRRQVARAAHIDGGRRAVLEHAVAGRQAPHGIDHDPQWIRALDLPGGELRIVSGHRARADDHRVTQRAQSMHVPQVLGAGHELRVAGGRGDEAVDALAQVPHRDRTRGRGTADRQIQVDERMTGIGGGHHKHPAMARLPLDQPRRFVEGHATQRTGVVEIERGHLAGA